MKIWAWGKCAGTKGESSEILIGITTQQWGRFEGNCFLNRCETSSPPVKPGDLRALCESKYTQDSDDRLASHHWESASLALFFSLPSWSPLLLTLALILPLNLVLVFSCPEVWLFTLSSWIILECLPVATALLGDNWFSSATAPLQMGNWAILMSKAGTSVPVG